MHEASLQVLTVEQNPGSSGYNSSVRNETDQGWTGMEKIMYA
jgi:hypothetical protein